MSAFNTHGTTMAYEIHVSTAPPNETRRSVRISPAVHSTRFWSWSPGGRSLPSGCSSLCARYSQPRYFLKRWLGLPQNLPTLDVFSWPAWACGSEDRISLRRGNFLMSRGMWCHYDTVLPTATWSPVVWPTLSLQSLQRQNWYYTAPDSIANYFTRLSGVLNAHGILRP